MDCGCPVRPKSVREEGREGKGEGGGGGAPPSPESDDLVQRIHFYQIVMYCMYRTYVWALYFSRHITRHCT